MWSITISLRLVLFLGPALILLTSFTTGSATAFLTGKSDSGRSEFYAEIRDIESFLEKAWLKIDTSTINYKTDEAHVILDTDNGVFTLYIDDKTDTDYPNHKFLKLWSIPSTFKVIKNESSKQIYTFKAKIYGTEPRKDKESHTPTITLNCKIEYEI